MYFTKLLLSLSLAALTVIASTIPVRSLESRDRDLTSIEGRECACTPRDCGKVPSRKHGSSEMVQKGGGLWVYILLLVPLVLRKWSFICSGIGLTCIPQLALLPRSVLRERTPAENLAEPTPEKGTQQNLGTLGKYSTAAR
ncbi:hypothetical protein C8R45DRAFT_923893 [Mycena sanguinolenta]|nr:hypothetical protein C8R45DRAFT_923893 [Mycena sanguinolenta]